MLKKILFLMLILFLFTTKAYAASPTTTYALSGSLTATNSSGISFFTLSGSTDTITGSNEAIGSITYSGGSFSNNIVIETGAGSTSPCPSGYTWNGSSCISTVSVTFSGGITLSNTMPFTLTTSGNSIIGGAGTNGGSITYSNGSLSGMINIPYVVTLTVSGNSIIGTTGYGNGTFSPNGSITFSNGVFSGTITSTDATNGLTFTGSGNSIIATYNGANLGEITAQATSVSPSCPTGTTLVNGECVSGYVLSGSGDTISYNGNSITYDSSTNTFSGSIPLSLTETLTEPATCSDGSTPTSGSCSGGAYLTCAESGYTLSGSTCSETVSGSFTLSGSSSNIDISGGNSSGSISMTQTEECPTGYTLSSGSCVANTNAGATSTFACTDGTNYQNCDSGSLSPSGSAYLCPLGQTQCNENTSTPQCPSGYTWNGSSCISTVSVTFSGGITLSNTMPFTLTTSGNSIIGGAGTNGGSITYSNGSLSGMINIPYVVTLTVSGNSIIGTTGYGNGTFSPNGSITFSNGVFSGTITSTDATNGLTFTGSGNSIIATYNGANLGEITAQATSVSPSCPTGTPQFNFSTFSGGITLSNTMPFTLTTSGNSIIGGAGTNGGSITYSNGSLSGMINIPYVVTLTVSGNSIIGTTGYGNGTFSPNGSITFSNGVFSGTITSTDATNGLTFTGSGNSIIATYNGANLGEITAQGQGQCTSYSCPLSGTPQGSAPGQNYTCVEPSGSSNYYCSPNLCYNDSTNTPVSTKETMPAPQTNNGTVTSCAPGQTTGCGCSGSIYIFPGQALQCTRDFALGENCCSRAKFLLGGRSCSSNSQILAEAIIYDNQYSPPVPVYSGSGDPDTAPITSCSASSIATGCGQQGEAIYLGDYCSLKLPVIGTCLAHTYVFCKFQGLLATIIQAQGRAQLAGGPDAVSWGSVSSPNCTGFTPTQFQELNFANMNLSEYIAVIKSQVSNTLTTSAISTQIANTTKSIGNEINQLETGGALTGTTP